VDNRLLEAKIAYAGLTKPKFAKLIGMDKVSVYRKLKGEREFSRPEIVNTVKILKLSEKEMNDIFFPELFFNEKVSYTTL
jgi:DNA-binding XRE family transcriptional regulator